MMSWGPARSSTHCTPSMALIALVVTGTDLLQDGQPPAGWPLDRPPMLLETSLPGVFAAGDVRHGSIKQVAGAVGEGSVAIRLVHQHLTPSTG
jgi:thioredoxin reductase (NADPH)